MTVLLTGADGKLASVVRPFLRSHGFSVVNWGRDIELHSQPAVDAAANRLNERVDALIHLAGGYTPGSDGVATRENFRYNFETFAQVYEALKRGNWFSPYPTIITIDAPFSATQEEMNKDRAYYTSKAMVRNYINMINGRERYAISISPATAIDTDERRDDIALRIIDLVTVPIYTHDGGFEDAQVQGNG